MNVTINPITQEDLPDVSTVFLTSFNNEGESWSEETSHDHVLENFNPDYAFAARVDKAIVGFILGTIITREKGKELFIDSIAVLPDHRGKGIGKKLLDTAVAAAQGNDINTLRLIANSAFRSFEWYKKMGYVESGWVEMSKGY